MKPQQAAPVEILESVRVMLFQDKDAPGPNKPNERYEGSLLNKYRDIICHDYKREKISPDDPPLQPRLKIWGVRPPAKETRNNQREENTLLVWSKEELEFLMKNL